MYVNYQNEGTYFFMKNMKNIVKSAAVITSAAALLLTSGCMGDTKWAFKSDEYYAKNSAWILNTYISTMGAVNKAAESDSSINIKNMNFDKQEIEGKLAKDWVYAEAKASCLRMITLNKLVKEYNAKVDQSTFDMQKQMYLNYYYTPSKELYEELGVSEDTFVEAYIMPEANYDAVFNAIYQKGGTKAVSDEDVEKYFTDNYVTYYYLTYNLKMTDDTGTSVDIDDETKDKYEENFRKYQHMLNDQSKTTKDVDEQYKVDFGAEESNGATETQAADDIENADLKKAVQDAAEKKAEIVTINDKVYLIYKGSIKEKAADIKPDDEITEENSGAVSRNSIVSKMKAEEYKEFFEDELDKLKYVRNDACIAKYSVMRTVDILKKRAGN